MRARFLISQRNRYEEMKLNFATTNGGITNSEIRLQEGMPEFHPSLSPTPIQTGILENIVDFGELFNDDKEAEMEATDHLLSVCLLDDSDEENA